MSPRALRAQGDGFAVEAASNHSYPVVLSSDTPFTRVLTPRHLTTRWTG